MVRFDLDGTSVVLEGVFAVGFTDEGSVLGDLVATGEKFAESVVGLGIIRFDFSGGLVVAAGEIVFPRRIEDASKMVVGLGIVLVYLCGFFEVDPGLVDHVQALHCVPEVIPSWSKVAIEIDGFEEMVTSFLELT